MQKSIDRQNFEVLLVEDGHLLKKAQALRGRLFFKDRRLDEDRFDEICQHVVVIDHSSQEVVGTYRLLLRSRAERNGGFYSQTEFDLSHLKENCPGEWLEMGRAGVEPAYRKYPILQLMWQAILTYIAENKVSYVFGCASVVQPSPQQVGIIFRYLQDKFPAPAEFKVYPADGKGYPYLACEGDYKERAAQELLPALIKGYLRLGALVCGEPVWDKEFDSADFFMLADAKKIAALYKKRFQDENS